MEYIVNIESLLIQLKKFLDKHGYVSKLDKQVFYDFLEKSDMSKGYSNLEILILFSEYFNTLLGEARDMFNEFQKNKISYNRNIIGYNTLINIQKSLNELILSYKDIFSLNYVKDDHLYSNELFYMFIEYQYRVKIDIPSIEIKELYEIRIIEDILKNIKNQWVFRGHADKSWYPEATLLRNINRETTYILDKYEIENKYKVYNLISKYKKIFGHYTLNYEFLSYMQHSTSYSPMIDFTNNFKIALSFALSNIGNINQFHNIDSSVICTLVDSEMSIDNTINNFEIGILSSKPWTVKDLSVIYKRFGRLHNTFLRESVSKQQVNDRMKYQNGLFLMYDGYISFPTYTMPYHLRKGLLKIIINHTVKKAIYDELYDKNRQYLQHYLLNPYQYFTE